MTASAPITDHDLTGHYNRFDVLRLELNREPIEPLREVGPPGR